MILFDVFVSSYRAGLVRRSRVRAEWERERGRESIVIYDVCIAPPMILQINGCTYMCFVLGAV